MRADGTWNCFYDNEGNLVSKSRIGSSEEWDYQYDHRNLMTGAQRWVGESSGTLATSSAATAPSVTTTTATMCSWT